MSKSLSYLKDHGVRGFLRRVYQESEELVVRRKTKIAKNNYIFSLGKDVTANQRSYFTDQRPEVDIIIPVYNAYDCVVKCVGSVLTNSKRCRLIIIDDASTDERIGGFLDEVNSNSNNEVKTLIIRNEANLGFVKTVNKAYRSVKNHFVILNSDTEVPPNWIERLFRPIFLNESTTGSVTPFSNAATICSFPSICEHGEIFDNLNLETLDQFFMKYGSLDPIEIPTGIGFCMAFNKFAVERIGLFNEKFGVGYGEENDWSMRAIKAGYKNLLVTDLFVYHKNSASFGSQERETLFKANSKILEGLHQDYFSRVSRFIKNDPAREVRETLAMIIDSQTEGLGKVILILDHLLGGGANTYSDFLCNELLKRNHVVVFVRYDLRKKVFTINYSSQRFTCNCNVEGFDFQQKNTVLKVLGIEFIIVNNIVSWPDPIAHVADIEKLGIPYLVFLHDYFFICPSLNLISSEGKFCNVPEDYDVCKECLRSNRYSDHYTFYKHDFTDFEEWKGTMSSFLRGARALVSFSESSSEIFRKAYGKLTNAIVNEHAVLTLDEFDREPMRTKNGEYESVNIGVLGSIGYHKGMKIIEDLINTPFFKKTNLRIIIFGNTSRFSDGYKAKGNKFMVYGKYNPKELRKLLSQHKVTMMIIPSIWPETFSFTTSEAIMLGYPAICFNLGAQAERIKKFNCGFVVEDVSTNALANAIEKLINSPGLIEELAENTKQYVPVEAAVHLDKVMKILECDAGKRKEDCLHPVLRLR